MQNVIFLFITNTSIKMRFVADNTLEVLLNKKIKKELIEMNKLLVSTVFTNYL